MPHDQDTTCVASVQCFIFFAAFLILFFFLLYFGVSLFTCHKTVNELGVNLVSTLIQFTRLIQTDYFFFYQELFICESFYPALKETGTKSVSGRE